MGLCHYDHHKDEAGNPTKGQELTCPKCGGPMFCGPFHHACEACDPHLIRRCGICGAPVWRCCC